MTRRLQDKKKTRLHLFIDSDLDNWLREEALKRGIPKTRLLEEVIKYYIDNHKGDNK